jgi:uncharacterized protein YkwD
MKKQSFFNIVILLELVALIAISAAGALRQTEAPAAAAIHAGVGELDVPVSREKVEEEGMELLIDPAVPLAPGIISDALKGEAMSTLGLVNLRRTSAGLGELSWNETLSQAAEVRAFECEDKFSHTRPDGSEWWTVNAAVMYGENLAKNYYDANSVVQAWMDSPAHRENILKADFTTMGVAAYEAGDGTMYWAQAFGY